MSQTISWNPSSQADLSVPVYVNGAQVVFSQWDFTFTLLHLFGGGAEGGEPAVSQYSVARIVMSPQHAKAFVEVLRQHMEAYEERFGTVPDLNQVTEGTGGTEEASS